MNAVWSGDCLLWDQRRWRWGEGPGEGRAGQLPAGLSKSDGGVRPEERVEKEEMMDGKEDSQ